FHRLLCERFDYMHDEKDWKRDQISLIEHIARRVPADAAADTQGELLKEVMGRETTRLAKKLHEALYHFLFRQPDLKIIQVAGLMPVRDAFKKVLDQELASRPAVEPAAPSQAAAPAATFNVPQRRDGESFSEWATRAYESQPPSEFACEVAKIANAAPS